MGAAEVATEDPTEVATMAERLVAALATVEQTVARPAKVTRVAGKVATVEEVAGSSALLPASEVDKRAAVTRAAVAAGTVEAGALVERPHRQPPQRGMDLGQAGWRAGLLLHYPTERRLRRMNLQL